jgi:membrane-associated phospholipid phosphatase
VGRRWVSALLGALACAVGLLWTWLLAFGTDAGVRLDQRIYIELAERRPAWGTQFALDATRLGDPAWFLVLVCIALAIPLVRRRWSAAAAGAVVIIGANLTTQLLQELTFGDRHVLLMPRAYWPSGHATAMVSVAFALLLGVPGPLRPVAALAAVVAAAVMGWAVVVVASHLPSDVVAAVLVCGIWMSPAVGGLAAAADRVREPVSGCGDQPAAAAHASS